MPGSTPPTSQLDWLISTTAMIVLLWSRATRDLLKSFGWGIAALHRLDAATKLPSPRRPSIASLPWRRESRANPSLKVGLTDKERFRGVYRWLRKRKEGVLGS